MHELHQTSIGPDGFLAHVEVPRAASSQFAEAQGRASAGNQLQQDQHVYLLLLSGL
jgi:hypothetical protein